MDDFIDDQKIFIHLVIKTRNRLTHMDGDGVDNNV